MSRLTPALLGTALLLVPATHAAADIIAADTFEGYPSGIIHSVNAPAMPGLTGNYFAIGTASDFYVDRTEADDSPGNPGEGRAVYDRTDSNNNARIAARSFDGTPTIFGSPDDTVYLGFTVDPSTTAGQALFGINFDEDDSLEFGIEGGEYSIRGISSNNSSNFVSGNTATDAEQRLVLRLTFNGDGSNEEATIFRDASAETDTTAIVLDVTTNLLNSNPAPYIGESIRLVGQGQSGQPIFFDDVVVATTFNEANLIPEPASLALLAAGGLCLLPRRRR
jgi:hypothetical protein